MVVLNFPVIHDTDDVDLNVDSIGCPRIQFTLT
jgi:hypothetical protein